ncbi:polysaccharide deacetylase family protein [Lactococcus protaetiae]|uniref:Polysaccharide deacetylase family protein n=1 Tax=Lactococcus protaetiae TaxID=2592653 RepID=A0A514Z919_9LACT|nr:polysaccharide deacetylase family protein [Lactococcus protaetiae]QDK71063.1 polysaccharide deacetylase family protein [Lactococcus protaetiae]
MKKVIGIFVVIVLIGAGIFVGLNIKHQHDVKVHREKVALAYKKLKNEAIKAEKKAEQTLADEDIARSEKLINRLKKSDRTSLTKQLNQVKEIREDLANAQLLVAEANRNQTDQTIANAQEKVNQLTSKSVSTDRAQLQAQINADKEKLAKAKAEVAAKAKADADAKAKAAAEQQKTAKSPKMIALTFDDGPNPTTTPQLLQTLQSYNVHATFFALGQQAQAYPSIIKQEAAQGNEVASHTWDHKDLTTLSQSAQVQEIMSAHNLINQLTGQNVTLFRPPYGSYDATTLAATPLTAINWSVDTNDWRYNSSAPVIQNALANAHDGAIILMHDIHPWSVAAVPTIIQRIKAQGYTFVTVSQLLEARYGGAQAQHVYFGK